MFSWSLWFKISAVIFLSPAGPSRPGGCRGGFPDRFALDGRDSVYKLINTIRFDNLTLYKRMEGVRLTKENAPVTLFFQKFSFSFRNRKILYIIVTMGVRQVCTLSTFECKSVECKSHCSARSLLTSTHCAVISGKSRARSRRSLSRMSKKIYNIFSIMVVKVVFRSSCFSPLYVAM